MIYAVELVVYRTIPTFGKHTETRHVITYSALLHESSIEEWQQQTIATHELEHPEMTFQYETFKRPQMLTMRQALDLYPNDFKLWCEEEGFSGLLNLLT